MSKKYTLLTFKGICMNFLLELKFFILSHPVTSKQPREIVQIHMHHAVCNWEKYRPPFATFLQYYLLVQHAQN